MHRKISPEHFSFSIILWEVFWTLQEMEKYCMIKIMISLITKTKLQVLCIFKDKLTFQESSEDGFDSLDAINIKFFVNIVHDLVYDVPL
jgi:hypothetical protein